MKKLLILPLLLLCACSSIEDNVYYKPNAQILPQHIKKIHVRPFINRTEVFALEDRLTISVVDEFFQH